MLRVYDNDEIFARKCFVLPNLAYIVHSSGEMIRSSLRLRFGLLILVATVTTLTCRIAVRRGFVAVGGADNELLSVSGSVAATTLSSLNTTFLKLAAVDIGEAKERKEVEQLLEGNFGSQLRSRSISSWRRENHLEARPRGSVIGSILIRTPKYFWNWYEFRRVLRDWYRRKRFEPEIMNQLVELVKGPIDRHYGFSNSDHRYGSCAVVGNSGILLQSEYGKLIDSHEAVIRLNNARIKGFERSVGSKTSISFVNSNILHLCARREGCFCHPYGDNVPLVMYICQPVHFMDYTICNSTNKSPLLITDSRFDLLCSRIVKYYSLKEFVEETGKSPIEWAPAHDGSLFHYSSGMQAVMLALGICEKVSIFGFGKSAMAKHHYHTNQKAELHLHDYEAEYAFYRDLVERSQVIPFLDDNFKIPPVIVYH